jgi:hypothetical protein
MNSWTYVAGSARSYFLACLVILLAGLSAFGQAGRGSISGTVSDPNGALLPGAQVVLLNTATGASQHTVTSAAGLYTFISLNPGQYQVTASQSGFAKVVRDRITVNVDQVTAVDITLHVGAATETVTVTAGTELVEPSNSTVGSLIPSETIDRVPLLYRNVYDLVQLSAGVIPVNGSPNSSDSMQSVQNISVGRPGVDVSADTINGSLVGSVYYMLDGSPIGIAENNSGAIIPAMNIPEDGVDEVRVETQNTPASYQSGAAGVISLVSKSGTNRFHGDIFGVFRPNGLSANEYFTKRGQLQQGEPNSPPDFHRYQEGGAIGGPIKKDKLFFFGDYEHTSQQQFEGNLTYTVPTSGWSISREILVYRCNRSARVGLCPRHPSHRLLDPGAQGQRTRISEAVTSDSELSGITLREHPLNVLHDIPGHEGQYDALLFATTGSRSLCSNERHEGASLHLAFCWALG